MTDYINKSGNTQLKADLSNWVAPAPISAPRAQQSGAATPTSTPTSTTPTGTEPTTTATTPTAAPYVPTTTEINDYVRANLNSPQAISSAMGQYNVSLDQIQKATGYSRSEMEQYINDSNDPALKASLAKW